MKKRIIPAIIVLVALVIGFAGWKFFGPSISASAGEFFYVNTGSSYADVKQGLIDKKYLKGGAWYDLAARVLHLKTVKPGRYRIKKGTSLFQLVKMFRNGNQASVNFVITKLRTREDLARKAGNVFEFDSLQMIGFLNNNDSLKKYGLDTNTVIAAVMPFTYNLNWNTTPGKLFQKFYAAYRGFWAAQRKQKADSLHLTPDEISTLASIVEEETLNKADKSNIASVYINRIRTGMPLQADPTIKFALRDFGLKRILNGHLKTVSPYNTYLHPGLPPGPICTPSVETIEAVLDAPKTDYYYFVASSNFDGSSIFTSNYDDHLKYARAYQQALDKRLDSVKKANSK